MKTKTWKSPTLFRQSRPLFRGVTTCLTIALFAGRLIACDFCLRLPRVPFEFDHAAAIEVAIATQEAAEQGTLNLNPTVTTDRGRTVPLSETTARQLVAQWIGTRPAKTAPSLRCTVELIFVDVDDTCWLDVRHGEILAADPRSGPADIRFMTTKAGFCQLQTAGLAKCEQLQWVAIEFAKSGHINEIDRLFPRSHSARTTDVVLQYDQQRLEKSRPNLIKNSSDKLGSL